MAVSDASNSVNRLLCDASDALGLHICFHDWFRRLPLTLRTATHIHPACKAMKRFDHQRCVDHDVRHMPSVVAPHPQGLVHRCPWGLLEIAVPVESGGVVVGILFAGPCVLARNASKHPEAIRIPSVRWLEKRVVLVRALAREVGAWLEAAGADSGLGRRGRILHFLRDRIDAPVSLGDLANDLHLSPSRTGHVVRELFGCTAPQLVRRVKLREAARLLVETDLSVGEVALRVGMEDPNYFSRLFARDFGLSPRGYRKANRREA